MFTWTTDGSSYMHAGADNWPANQHLANGSGTFSYALSPTTCTCESIWNGTSHGAGGARPAIGVGSARTDVANCDCLYREFTWNPKARRFRKIHEGFTYAIGVTTGVENAAA